MIAESVDGGEKMSCKYCGTTPIITGNNPQKRKFIYCDICELVLGVFSETDPLEVQRTIKSIVFNGGIHYGEE